MVIKVKKDGQYVKIPYLSTDVAVGEAPADGKQYARQDKAWSEVVIPDVDLTDVNAAIAANTAAIGTKVDKVTGKQLSTNDYTTAEKTKLTNIPTPDSIVTTNDNRLTVATPSKAGIMSAADKAQLDSTLTSTEIDSRLAAAVSSVYRVKGSKATFADLPTTDVAVGDVWNIEDTGANYVAINSDPIEWDKLSETVDLTPYMLTSTANNTFVKKSGDTMTGNLKLSTSQNPNLQFTVDGVAIGSVGAAADGSYLYNLVRNGSLKYTNDGKLTFEGNTVWHAGNDGAGSGLDADSVDGIQSTNIVYGENNTGATTVGDPNVANEKANTITKSGFYRCNQDTLFQPLVIHCQHSAGSDSGYAFQIGTAYSSGNSLFFRINSNGSWEKERAIVDTSTVLTQAEYDALGDTVNSNGKIYFIKE